MTDPDRAAYSYWATDTIRYGDTDRQGHVNNAVFATFFETGRVGIVYDQAHPVLEPGAAWVVARLEIDFKAELRWPGEALIGTRVSRVGRSSATLEQAIFQNGVLCARGVSVVVMMDETTRKSRPLSETAAARLRELQAGP